MVLILKTPAKKQKFTSRQWRKWTDWHGRLPIGAEVSIFVDITTLIFSSSSTSSIFNSAQGCCHFISQPHFHEDQRAQQKICVNCTVIINISIFSDWKPLQSYGNWEPYNSMQREKHAQDWISDNLKAYFHMHCMNLKTPEDCLNRRAGSSQSAFIWLFKLWERN